MDSYNLSQKDLETIARNFFAEIKNSHQGIRSSLRFIVQELSPTPLVKENEIFQVAVVGGSNFKKALIKKTKAGIEVLKLGKEKTIKFVDSNNFLKIVCKELYPDVRVLALNFAYPLRPILENGKTDGILISTSKGVSLHGLLGKKIGRQIEDYVFEKSKRKIKVAVANDTVCLMLSGLTKFKWNELAAGAIGTGTNFALFTNKNRLVNLESANFNKFIQSAEGKIIDKESNSPGRALFEKEVAGKYLYQHFNLIVKKKNLPFPVIKSTEELNNVSLKNIPTISGIAKNLMKKSAQMAACQMAGITLFKKQNMVFNMEGSLFWKGNNYQETVRKTVKQLIPQYQIDFVEIENSSIIGAAKLVS